ITTVLRTTAAGPGHRACGAYPSSASSATSLVRRYGADCSGVPGGCRPLSPPRFSKLQGGRPAGGAGGPPQDRVPPPPTGRAVAVMEAAASLARNTERAPRLFDSREAPSPMPLVDPVTLMFIGLGPCPPGGRRTERPCCREIARMTEPTEMPIG